MKTHTLIVLICLLQVSCSSPLTSEEDRSQDQVSEVSFNVHTFYYNWYGNVSTDGKQHHWNHDVLPHWSDHSWDDAEGFPGGESIGANFYPELGCYSSNNPELIDEHMDMIHEAGIGVVVITWWGKDSFEDKSISQYLKSAERAGLKVAIHIEPFYRSAEEFKTQVNYLASTYGRHPAFYKVNEKPLYYVYDSYKLEVEEWHKVLLPDGEHSLRDTSADAVFIGLWVKEHDGEFFLNTGFDGFYTYFASDGFEYGCTSSNWPLMSAFAKDNDLLFIPCAGPGYIDTRIRPWNAQNIKDRKGGEYYETMFKAAALTKPDYIGITSFNEWHEGTQIEPAISKNVGGYTYEDYGDGVDTWHYIHKTQKLIQGLNNDIDAMNKVGSH